MPRLRNNRIAAVQMGFDSRGREPTITKALKLIDRAASQGPDGEVLAQGGQDEETVISAEIDQKKLEEARFEKPFLRDLRSELFYSAGRT